ncbi:MFS transporter [Ignatzschineria rhizosphaerae]|uniref:MFS transporter n=1 Tax=Ignatzschineria rhizosphaerae TaxID=2923279 RepID=A0ABY3X5L1_9GAMM|nr:MFS transporter [Ignatzschineria rhizosphaerae]UNM97056.1 MFS transporter [Ignatzschineria rhizosphaerae]
MSSKQTPLQTPAMIQKASWGALFQNGNALRSFTLVGGVILYAINMYIVTTILPNIVNDIGGLNYFSWNTTLFIVSSIIGSALTSKAVAILGARSAYLFALIIFLIGSIWCAMAFSMWFLLIGRVLQGLGGGMLFALGYILIRIVFEPYLWTRATALVSGMWGIATLLGPAIGGIFAQSGHWRWAFWSLIPFIIILALVVIRKISGKSAQEEVTNPPIPFLALILLVLSVTLISLSSLKDTLLWTGGFLSLGILFLILMIMIDKSAKNRLLPTGAYSLRSTLGKTYLAIILLMFGMTTEIFVPYFLQIIHHIKPLSAGYITAIMAAGWTLSSLPSSAQIGKSRQLLMRLSPIIITLSLATLALTMSLDSDVSRLLIGIYILALLGIGFGIGLVWPHLLNLVFISAPKGEEAITSSSVTTVQLYATALAAALVGLVANQAGMVTIGGIEGAKQASNWLFMIFTLAPIFAAIFIYQIVKLPAFKE